MEQHLDIKTKLPATTWTNLESNTVSQTEKTLHMIPYIQNAQKCPEQANPD